MKDLTIFRQPYSVDEITKRTYNYEYKILSTDRIDMVIDLAIPDNMTRHDYYWSIITPAIESIINKECISHMLVGMQVLQKFLALNVAFHPFLNSSTYGDYVCGILYGTYCEVCGKFPKDVMVIGNKIVKFKF